MQIWQLLGPTADGVSPIRLRLNTNQKLWTLAFVLSLLGTQLYFFPGEMDRNGTLETQWSFSMQINFTAPQSPECGSWECFSCDPVEKANFHWQLSCLI